MGKSGGKWGKVGKSGKTWLKVGKVGKSGEKWGKVGKSGEKWGKVGKSGKKVVKSGERWEKWGKVDKKLEKVEKVGVKLGKWEKWGKVGKSPKITFDHCSCHFRSIRNFFLLKFLDKMAAGGHFGLDDMSVIELVRDIWMNNACVKFEERSLNPSKVIALTTKL